MAGRVLSVAESDSSGGGGIQADIKTILALGGYATTAVTGVTAQNTKGISSFQLLDPAIVGEQMRTVLEDLGTDAIKTGILSHELVIDVVGDVLDEYLPFNYPVVIDPALMTQTGEILLDETAIATLKRRLFVRATVLTPNLREAEILTGMTIRDIDDMRHATSMMRTLGAETVVLKAGQVLTETDLYLVSTTEGERIYERHHLETNHTLGVGCTLASAIAVSLGQGMDIYPAIERALDFLHQAILHAPGYGYGRGPINHAFEIEKHATFFHPEQIRIRKLEGQG